MNFSTKLKKLFCLILALVLAIGLFAGCSERGNESSDSIVSSDKQQANTSDDGSQNNDVGKDDKNSDDVEPLPEGTQNIATLPDFDIEKGTTIKIMAWWVHPKVGDPDMDLWPQTDRLLKQLYDVNVEYLNMPINEVATKHAAMVMAGDPADVVNLINWSDYPYSFVNGLYEPLDDIIPLDHPIFDPVRKYIDILRINGKAYWAVHIVRVQPYGFIYNKTLLEEAGLEDPWELFKRNEWTWDTFFDYCKELTVDKDGDGNIDQYGAAVVREFINRLPNTLGYPISKMTEDNKVEINLRDEGLMEYYEFLKKIGPFGEGVFHPLSFKQGDASQTVQEEFANGNIGFYYGWDTGTGVNSSFRPMVDRGELEIVILPRYPKADKNYVGVSVSGLGISKGAKHPQAAAAYITLQVASYFRSAAEVVEDTERIINKREKELGVDLASLYNGEYELSKDAIYGALYVNELPIKALEYVAKIGYLEKNYIKEFPDRGIFDFGQFAGFTSYFSLEPIFSGDQNGNPVTAQQIIEQMTPQMQQKIEKFEKALSGES